MKKLSLFGLAVIFSTAMFARQTLLNVTNHGIKDSKTELRQDDKTGTVTTTGHSSSDVKDLRGPGGKHPHKKIRHKHRHGHKHQHGIRQHH